MSQRDPADEWDSVSLVVSSGYRISALAALVDQPSTPSDIAEKTGSDIAHISRALQDLRDEDLVELLVPEDRKKGRIYGLTNTGERVHERLEQMGKTGGAA